jgi:N-acetylated-alpha-linked acidic dipeptidase
MSNEQRVGVSVALALVCLALRIPTRGDAQSSAAQAFESSRAEAAFASSISRDRISDVHRELTAHPHIAGSPRSREVARYLAKQFEAAGLETTIAEYRPWLSTPRTIDVSIAEPQPVTLRTTEPASAADPDTSSPELGPGFVAYSASADVTGEVVYVNYGLPADYEALRRIGIDVRGKIALARYARSHRAVKVHTAEQAGARGILIYSDPADDGAVKGEVWPNGPWRSAWMLQRGNAKYSWFWHGDPLTPGTPARDGADALDPKTAPTLPRICAAVLSSDQAEEIFRRLGGATVPSSFQGGLQIAYHAGPGPVRVRMNVQMDDGLRPIHDVIAQIRGARQPDRLVLLGTHHDAWTFGGVDPGSATSVVVEVARGLAALAKSGWQPDRTIRFAIWDAEEFGLVGSTEYAEDHERELRERAVCYINSDFYMRGRLDAGGVPSLADFIAEVARSIPGQRGSLFDEWKMESAGRGSMPASESSPDLAALGSGADFVAFQDYLGLPTLSLEFDFQGSYGAYHSNYDTRRYMERVVDPGFEQGATLARLLGVATMRLASDRVLPFRYGRYARSIGRFITEMKVTALDESARTLTAVAIDLDARLAREMSAGRLSEQAIRDLNDRLVRIEQALLDESEPPAKRWYRHVVYGWNIYSLYDGQPIPGLSEAIRLGDAPSIARETGRVRSAITRMTEAVRAARDQLARER